MVAFQSLVVSQNPSGREKKRRPPEHYREVLAKARAEARAERKRRELAP